MPHRLPTTADFPPYLHLTITPPPSTAPRPTNILILLHGLGDTSDPFTKLGKHLNLPETACLSLQAPNPLPFDLGGFHWGDDITFDQSTGRMDVDTGFEKVVGVIKRDIIEEALVKICGYGHREIVILGLGQGGMAAMATGSSFREQLGGIISICGPLPQSCSSKRGVSTPVMLLGGSSNTLVTRSALDRTQATFTSVEYCKWKRAGDGMPGNRDEMLPIMQFFARRLRSRQGVPDGSVELG